MIIDSHCHFDFDGFDENREQVLQRARDQGVNKIIVPGVKASSWHRVKAVCEQYTECVPCYGLHPYFIDEHRQQDIDELDRWLGEERPVAVGECGLDFYLQELDPDKQMEFFEAQLALAEKHDIPLVIHARKATEQVIQALRRYKNLRGMMHSYSGSLEQARQLIDINFYLSFGGAITYDRAKRLHRMIAELPLDHLLVETDAPDQPVQSHQGEINEPGYITEVVETLARLQTTTTSNIVESTRVNAERLFAL